MVFVDSNPCVDMEVAAWDLGSGESEVISLCRKGENKTAIIDDLAARKCASTTTEISLLLENGFRIADNLIDIMLRESGERQGN